MFPVKRHAYEELLEQLSASVTMILLGVTNHWTEVDWTGLDWTHKNVRNKLINHRK